MKVSVNKLLTRLGALIGAVAAWELASYWWETARAEKGYDYWRVYYDAETVRRSDNIRQVHAIRSTGVTLHIDVYPRPEADAPVLVFNHGAAGYCRLFVALALSFYERGYTVVLPDQRGQGFSGGRCGDYTVAECTQNIVDVARWAKTRFGTPLFLAGGSVGGGLTYYAAAAGAPAEAIACLNLFDFGNGVDGVSISRFAPLVRYAAIAGLMTTSLVLLKPLHWVRIPFDWLGAFDKLMDKRDAAFQAKWDADPIPARLVTLRSVASLLTTPPGVALEQNETPTLVINQGLDRMVDPAVTRRNYERLGGPKRYLEVPYGHWSSQPGFWGAIVEACDEWFRQQTSSV